MHIAGRHDRLFELFAEGYDLPVDILQDPLRSSLSSASLRHKHVVSERLDLQIIIKFTSLASSASGRSVQDRLIQLSRLTGRSNDQALSVTGSARSSEFSVFSRNI